MWFFPLLFPHPYFLNFLQPYLLVFNKKSHAIFVSSLVLRAILSSVKFPEWFSSGTFLSIVTVLEVFA